MIKRVFNTQAYSNDEQLLEVSRILKLYIEQLKIDMQGSAKERDETVQMLTKLAQIMNNPFKLRKEFYSNEILPHILFDSLIHKVIGEVNS